MRRILTVTIVSLFAGMALAGCAGNNDPGNTGGATQATASATPLSPKVNETVTFQATNAGEGDTASWSFGDGRAGAGLQTTHAYEAPGQYIVLLNLTTKSGATSTNDAALTYVTVTLPDLAVGDITEQTPPVALAASSAQVIQAGGSVSFDAAGSGAWIANPEFDASDVVQSPAHNPPFIITTENTTFTWDFGDGQTGTGATANHTFAQPGLFPVKLTVRGVSGTTGTSVVTVRVLPEAPPTPGVRNPTVFTIATIGEPESLDPAYDYEVQGGAVLQQVYETLYNYKRDSAEQLEPRLATAMPDYNANRTELTIKLRPNVKFHNGETMTAEDVKFSWDRAILMNDPDGPAWMLAVIAGAEDYMGSEGTSADRQAYLDAGGVTVLDPTTIRVKLAYSDPAFLYKISFTVGSIVSMKAVCDNAEPDFVDCLPPPGETRHPWMDTHEAGTGAFLLEAWIPGQQVILKRFDDYWGNAPALEKVIIQKVDDFNTRLLMLLSGQADDIYVPVDHARDIEGRAGLKVSENPSWTVDFIGFNQKFCGGPEATTFDDCMAANGGDAPKGADGQPDPLFFSDINMRKAWVHAFDYDVYLNSVLEGHGTMLNGPLPEGIFGHDTSIPKPARDMEAARGFLAQTNHSDGFSVTIFYNSGNTVREKTANLLAQNLEELAPGKINADVRALDWSTAFLPKQRALALPVFYLGWAPDYAYPDNYVVTFAHSQAGVYSKRIGYANPDLDAKLDALVRETDEAKLRQGWSEAVKELGEDYPYMWLRQQSNYHVVREWVHGYYYNPMHSGGPNTGDYTAISKR